MDLRAFIERLSEHGMLRRVTDEVNVTLELGRIARQCQEPTLFDNLKGYPGWRVFTNGLSSCSAIGLALGCPPESGRHPIARELSLRKSSPLAPCMVSTGPVLQNVQTQDIDLTRLPIPQWHPNDGGRYLGTWHINVTKDCARGGRNLGVYRMELLDSKRATVSTSSVSHLGIHLAQAEKSGRPLEMAVAIGVGESTLMAAAAAPPEGIDEYALAGGLQQEPLRLVKCRTVDLEVPADAEIVVEGVIQRGERVQDGPYLDYAGKTDTNPSAYVFEATGLMFRNDPIFRGSSIGHPGAEDHQLFAALADVGLVDFHGSRLKQRLQNLCLRNRSFELFQLIGRLRNPMR